MDLKCATAASRVQSASLHIQTKMAAALRFLPQDKSSGKNVEFARLILGGGLSFGCYAPGTGVFIVMA